MTNFFGTSKQTDGIFHSSQFVSDMEKNSFFGAMLIKSVNGPSFFLSHAELLSHLYYCH